MNTQPHSHPDQSRRIAWMRTRVMLAAKLDRLLGRKPKELAVLDYVQRNAPAGDPQAVLRAMDEFAVRKRWMMNVGPAKGSILEEALRSANARRVLEIGAYCGYSATLIGAWLARVGGSLISIEKSARCAGVARGIVAHAGLAERVDVRTDTLTDHLHTLGEPFDVVFLDHWKDEYLPDLKRLESAGLLRSGSIVVADNVGAVEVPDYLDYVRNSGGYRSTFHESTVEYNPNIRDGVEVSVRLKTED
jgi:catechol O-methyltransferase